MNYRIYTTSLLLSAFCYRKKKVGTLVNPNVTDLALFVFIIRFSFAYMLTTLSLPSIRPSQYHV